MPHLSCLIISDDGQVTTCSECEKEGHWKGYYSWMDTNCVKGCVIKMKLLRRKQEHSNCRRVFTCKSSPRCNGFVLEDDPMSKGDKSSTSNNNEGIVKLTILGDNLMIVGGSMNGIV